MQAGKLRASTFANGAVDIECPSCSDGCEHCHHGRDASRAAGDHHVRAARGVLPQWAACRQWRCARPVAMVPGSDGVSVERASGDLGRQLSDGNHGTNQRQDASDNHYQRDDKCAETDCIKFLQNFIPKRLFAVRCLLRRSRVHVLSIAGWQPRIK